LEITFKWSKKDLLARRTASCGSADSCGAVGDSAWEVGFPSTGSPLGLVSGVDGRFSFQILRSTQFAQDEIENKYVSLSEWELKLWKSDYERNRDATEK
jgi:hypothetical protein